MLKDRFKPIRKKFPEYREVIDCLLMFDEDFQEICNDYEVYRRALEDPRLLEQNSDFRLLCSELEDEMLSRLNRFPTTGSTFDEELSITIS